MKEEIHRSTRATLGDSRPTLERQLGYYCRNTSIPKRIPLSKVGSNIIHSDTTIIKLNKDSNRPM